MQINSKFNDKNSLINYANDYNCFDVLGCSCFVGRLCLDPRTTNRRWRRSYRCYEITWRVQNLYRPSTETLIRNDTTVNENRCLSSTSCRFCYSLDVFLCLSQNSKQKQTKKRRETHEQKKKENLSLCGFRVRRLIFSSRRQWNLRTHW